MADHLPLYDLTYAQLQALLVSWGEPRFRADQLWRWLYSSLADGWEQMVNLPAGLRQRLAAETGLSPLVPVACQESASGQAHKVLFHLHDGETIESVLMRYTDRRTACISTQVGCGMGCLFCATGQGGLVRNLSAGEIVDQVIHLARQVKETELGQRSGAAQAHPIGNVVLMGMGEPLANYAATLQAIETLADPRGYNLGARRFTLSTVGLAPGIRRLAQEALPVNLAVSLHAADDELRNQLVPVNRRYPLAELMAAVRDYAARTKRRVSIEYALIDRVNDAPQQAQELARLLEGLLCHVNLIPLNPTPGSPWQPPPRERVDAFRAMLETAGVPTTVRIRRGIDIEAGCGQLRRRQLSAASDS
ncbi:MAG: 23S rRNA (adenine(2503)-C(2))-methyltransferase RlmN [Anaerolineae bacterium]|nr:23S rRNA (adenine(2503)-C(2))-methyltransferase RlmN [Anaerolineae bacterium]